MTPRDLYIGTPCHDNRVHKNYHASILRLATCGRYNLQCTDLAGGGISIARNKLANLFMTRSTAPRILWLDSDVSFTPEDVDALWERDLPIVGAFYAHKVAHEIKWSCRGDGKDPDATGLVEVQAMGTGGLMVKREVFQSIQDTLKPNYIEDWADGTGQEKFAYFTEGVVCDPDLGFTKPTLLSEDWMFAYHARKCGFKIHGDTKVQFGHWEGATCFPVQEV